MYDVFSMKDFSFPKDFLWGSATAGHQIEGMNTNSANWYSEQEKIKTNKNFELSGKACNHYNMVEQDIKLLREMEHQVFRMTIEWSRIQPSENEFSEEELQHYINELNLLRSAGIKVFLTLVHFVVPKWFADLGGFTKLENFKYFEKYLRFLLPRISEYIDFWNVLNEFNLNENVDIRLNCIVYHGRAYHIIKEYSDKPIGTAHSLKLFHPYQYYDKADRTMVDYMDYTQNEFFFHAIRTGEIVYPFRDAQYFEEVKDTCDFWSINCYVREMISARRKNLMGDRYNNKHLKMIPMEFYLDEIFPEGLFHALTRLKDKPVFIAENGCSCFDDRFRIVYITTYLSALAEAIKAGVDVKGYLYWSTMDNYEWGSFTPRFGLIDVNFETFERKIKPSGYYYRDIIRNNGFNQEILRKYLNELPILGGLYNDK